MKTWKVLKLGIEPVDKIVLCCPHCGTGAEMPIARVESPIIAAIGLGLIFDNPCYNPKEQLLPTLIKCRHCRRMFFWDDSKDSENG